MQSGDVKGLSPPWDGCQSELGSEAPARCLFEGAMGSDPWLQQSCLLPCHTLMEEGMTMGLGIWSQSCHSTSTGGAQDHDAVWVPSWSSAGSRDPRGQFKPQCGPQSWLTISWLPADQDQLGAWVLGQSLSVDISWSGWPQGLSLGVVPIDWS